MKKIILSLSLFVFTVVLTGCKTQQTSINADAKNLESEFLYYQAQKALEDRKFIIEGDEFFFIEGKKSVQSSPDSYISMNENKAVIRFSPELYPHSLFAKKSHIEDDTAKIIKEKSKKKNQEQYTLEIKEVKDWVTNKILITLYKNSNKCYVQIYSGRGHTGSLIVNFTGYIYPLED